MGEDQKSGDRTELEHEHSRRPEANPGNISEDPEPHHARSPSTTEPHPPRNYDEVKPLKGDG